MKFFSLFSILVAAMFILAFIPIETQAGCHGSGQGIVARLFSPLRAVTARTGKVGKVMRHNAVEVRERHRVVMRHSSTSEEASGCSSKGGCPIAR